MKRSIDRREGKSKELSRGEKEREREISPVSGVQQEARVVAAPEVASRRLASRDRERVSCAP